MLCPEGGLKKSIQYILGLVFLLCVIAACGITVKKADFKIEAPALAANDTAALDTAAAEYVYSYALNRAGIDFSEITVFTDKSDSGSISINKILIRSSGERERILEALGDAAKNIEVEIINE